MYGFGTIINVTAIIAGGILGLLFGQKFKPEFQQAMIIASGISVLFLGIGGAMEGMLSVSNHSLISGGSMMIILSIVLGAVIGELFGIEAGMEKFGEYLKRKTNNTSDKTFVNGFMVTSFTVCIGAMAVVGAINDGISGDHAILVAKSALDFILVMAMAASMGKGCVFSAIPVGIFQGTITILAQFVAPIMTKQALSNLSLVGSILIFCVGVNLIWGKKVKVANLLPSLLFAIGFAFLPF